LCKGTKNFLISQFSPIYISLLYRQKPQPSESLSGRNTFRNISGHRFVSPETATGTADRWEKGTIEGLLLRRNVTLQKLEWDKKTVKISLSAPYSEKIKVELGNQVKILNPCFVFSLQSTAAINKETMAQ
jgi:hypothetical protein